VSSASRILASVAGRTDVDEELALLAERERLRGVLAIGIESGDDHFGLALRHQRVAHAIADDLGVGADVEEILAPRDAGPREVLPAKSFLLLETTIAVGITECDDAARRRPLADRSLHHVQIAARTQHHVASGADVIGHYRGTKSRGQRDAAVAGIAQWTTWLG
jgi:hypothetical protein